MGEGSWAKTFGFGENEDEDDEFWREEDEEGGVGS